MQEPPQTQQNYWQQPYNTQGYNQNVQQQQHYGQQYENQQMGGFQNHTAGYQQQAYNNPQYNQLTNQNNVHGNAIPQTGQHNEGEGWDNWNWGDEDNSNVQAGNGDTQNQVAEIGNTFSNDGKWNWEEDAKPAQDSAQARPVGDNVPEVQNQFPKVNQVKTENDTNSISLDSIQDQSKLSVNRKKLDTPQWSTESQLSQESSDDIIHTSESDKSHIMSRSSTISHSTLSGYDLAAAQNLDDVPGKGETYENKEIVTSVKHEQPPPKSNPTPPPPKITQTPPLMPPTRASEDSKNPYKRTDAQSHVSNKFRAPNITPLDSRQNVYSFHNQQVNLETLPDNSEQPDPVPSHTFQRVKPVAHLPDNNEVPINDRNQYLETGQLSEGNLPEYNREIDVGARQEVGDTLPPPGLSRMVPGQMEQSEMWETSETSR
ncbi:hypothetical protein JTB14_037566 [Gonioctena quinquepunctata]|nr:hypothetical protein JTB14_037566 [Gonioctena quinquepunctata]